MRIPTYAATQRETLIGRALEREVFSRVTARLDQAGGAEGTPATLAAALEENRYLWRTLAVDLSNDRNAAADELKAGLLSLAAFVETHTARVHAGDAGIGILVTINRNIIDGLTPAATARAA